MLVRMVLVLVGVFVRVVVVLVNHSAHKES